MSENSGWRIADIRELTETEYLRWYSLLSDEKKARVDRFRFDEDKKRTVAGEMLARKMISERCPVAPEDIIFAVTEKGKPYAENADVQFNISHSENLVVCAVSDKPVGVDIEKIRPVDLKTVRHFCNDSEIEYIFGHKPEKTELVMTENADVLRRFFELWTKKEAYVKYLGDGLECIHDKIENVRIHTFETDGYMVTIIKPCQ